MNCWYVRLDGQEDVEGVGQSLDEEEKGMDSGAAWAVGADPIRGCDIFRDKYLSLRFG